MTVAATRNARKPLNTNGAILWQGKSRLTGLPIVLIVTGLRKQSANSKTGDELQTWILCEDESPMAAVMSGGHQSICGKGAKGCPLMGIRLDGTSQAIGRECYVDVAKAPESVWGCYTRGGYRTLDGSELVGLVLRCGSYGDPAAVPFHIWESAMGVVKGWTGYTRQWQWCDQRLSRYLMASVSTEAEAQLAMSMGWRYFRVREREQALVVGQEFACPASAEMGHRVTCEQCQKCCGTSSPARNVTIIRHGGTAPKVTPMVFLKREVAA